MSIKKSFLWLTISIVGVVGFWAFLNRQNLTLLKETGASFYAKEMCTCIFVLEQNEDYCRNYTKQYFPLERLNIDYNSENQKVEAEAVGVVRTAVYISERLGCRLQTNQSS